MINCWHSRLRLFPSVRISFDGFKYVLTGKAEVQSLIALVSCSRQIFGSLLLSHSIPDFIPVSVAQDVVYLGEDVYSNIHGAERNEDAVATKISRSIV